MSMFVDRRQQRLAARNSRSVSPGWLAETLVPLLKRQQLGRHAGSETESSIEAFESLARSHGSKPPQRAPDERARSNDPPACLAGPQDYGARSIAPVQRSENRKSGSG